VKAEREFSPTDDIPWVPVCEGLNEKVLSGDPTTGSYTRLLRFDPGVVTPETLKHDFWEEVLILEGAIRDLRLDEEFTPGMYACRPPGMPHGPWASPGGCITFEVRWEL